MIIVSQDEEIIINFDNVQAINVHYQNKKQVCAWFNVDEGPNGSVVLGEYKTEERVKEVLQEIISKYSSYLELKGGPAIMQGDIGVQPNIFNIPKVYYMPKE